MTFDTYPPVVAPSLTLRSSPGHGMHVHLARSKRDASKIKSDATFIPISESASTCTFFNQVSHIEIGPIPELIVF